MTVDLDAIKARTLDIPPPYNESLVEQMQVTILQLVGEVERLRALAEGMQTLSMSVDGEIVQSCIVPRVSRRKLAGDAPDE